MTDIIKKINEIGDIKIINNAERTQLKKIVKKYDAILCSTNINIDKDLLSNSSKLNLKYVITPSVGVDHLDISYLKKNKIKIFSLKNSFNATKMIYSPAELTFAHILNISRNFFSATSSVRQKKWYPNNHIGFELSGKVIGIIGMGAVGSILAKYCKAFGLKIISYDPFKRINDPDIYQTDKIENLLINSDIISINVSGESKNDNLISESEFKLMKNHAILINTSRGNVVEIKSLIKNLKESKIAAAGIDVIFKEHLFPKKYPRKLLKDLDKLQKENKLFITPHIGGSTFEARLKRLNFVIDDFISEIKN